MALLVKVHGLKFPALYSCDLRTDKSRATFEILRAILRPYFELSMVRGQGLKMLPLPVRTSRNRSTPREQARYRSDTPPSPDLLVLLQSSRCALDEASRADS